MGALKKKGLRIAPFKIGPDFIDPGHHNQVTGRNSRNLDGWMLSREYNRAAFAKDTQFADFAVVEGVMGLFDGYDGKSEDGSTAQMAKWLGLPVLLVVNARSMARSAAALLQGFERFDKDLEFAGVVFNNIGSKNHLVYLKEALEDNVRMPCLGGILREDDLRIPERHLGLVTTEDHPFSEDFLSRLIHRVEKGIDLDRLLKIAGFSDKIMDLSKNPETGSKITVSAQTERKSHVRIGVAKDNAFCFYYPDNFELLQKAGAQLVFFSPVKDERLPENIHGLYFGGGYPELYAKRLAENHFMKEEILSASRNRMPIYGECGGFMYLCNRLYVKNGDYFPMTGCFPFYSRMKDRLHALGYREIRLTENCFLGKIGTTARGHEFHYSEMDVDSARVQTVYEICDRKGAVKPIEGYRIDQTLGSYVHLHFGSNPGLVENFVNACALYEKAVRTHS